MKCYFYLVPFKDSKDGANLTRKAVFDNSANWIQCDDVIEYLTTGYSVMNEYVVYNDKTYILTKNFIDIAQKRIVYVCIEYISE